MSPLSQTGWGTSTTTPMPGVAQSAARSAMDRKIAGSSPAADVLIFSLSERVGFGSKNLEILDGGSGNGSDRYLGTALQLWEEWNQDSVCRTWTYQSGAGCYQST